jgi:hypothetical protein
MTNDEFPYWSEEQTMKFLNYNIHSMENLRRKKVLTKHQIGHRYFYDKNEIIKLIEDSKVYEQDNNEYQKYIQHINKGLSGKELNSLERIFITTTAKRFVNSIFEIIPEKTNMAYKHRYILEKCLKHNNFSDVAETLHLTKARVSQIFDASIRYLTYSCMKMKKNYEENYDSIAEEIELLKKQNYELKAELFEFNKDSHLISDNVNPILFKKVIELDMSVRLINVLHGMDVYTLGDILRHKKQDFFRCRNFGKKSFDELIDVLDTFNLKLKR